jgi:hypothetical protein
VGWVGGVGVRVWEGIETRAKELSQLVVRKKKFGFVTYALIVTCRQNAFYLK